jgi:Phosphotransferase enzyme family
MPLPIKIEDVDLTAVNAILAASGISARALDVRVNEVLHGTATKVRMTVEWDDHGRTMDLPDRLVLKGGFGAHRAAMAHIYYTEEFFYRTMQDWLHVSSPRCIATAADPDGGQAIVLLEDLDAAGAQFCRVVDPIAPEQASGFLDLLASLHSQTWGASGRGAKAITGVGTWQALPTDATGDYARGQLGAETWSRYMALPRGQAVSRRFHDPLAMRRALEAIDAYTLGKPQCLLHADFHLGNLYFDFAGNPCALDWQGLAMGHWSHDVTYFLVSALDQADRRACVLDLIAYYLARLSERGVDGVPSMDEAREAFRIQLADGLFYWMVNPPEWQAEENNCAVASRFADAALDHGTFQSA